MTNLDSILRSRRHHFVDKVLYSQAMVFPVVMYGCESWTIKKAEHQKTDAFKLRAGGEEGNRGRDGWMASSTQWT